MAPLRLESRMPRYEGHLILNQAILTDSPQTSACTAWSETWCSLEDAKLLVYKDRMAALITPDHMCAVIDVRNFACVQISSDHSLELVLSTCLPEPAKTYPFRPKSAMSLNWLATECVVRDNTEAEPRPSITSIGRISFQATTTAINASSTFSVKTDAESRRNMPWTKLASGSRKLYNKVSSNGPLRINDTCSSNSACTTPSIASISDPRESIDFASSGAPSPCTPHSATLSNIFQSVPIRASSVDAFQSWLDALTLTLKLHQEMALASSPFITQQKCSPSRPSLGNVPGFRTTPSLQASPLLSNLGLGRGSTTEEATPKACRKRHSSSTSLSFALNATHESHHDAIERFGKTSFGSQQAADAWNDIANHNLVQAPLRRPDTSDMTSSSAKQNFSCIGAKRQDRKHKRSISTASSSLSFSAAGPKLSPLRRNSVSSTQLLSSDSGDASVSRSIKASFTHADTLSLGKQSTTLSSDRGVIHSVANQAGTKSVSIHRRSGSLLRFNSTRILAWRDTFTPSEQPKANTSVGIGLDVDQGDVSSSSRADTKSKLSKGFPRLRSLRLLPKRNEFDGNNGDVSVQGRQEESCSSATCESQYSEDILTTSLPRSAAPPKIKGMSRTSSLLSLTKNALSSFRDRSSSKQNVRHVFDVPQEGGLPNDFLHDTSIRIHGGGCDFSYELVAPTGEASPTRPPANSSRPVEAGLQDTSVLVSSEVAYDDDLSQYLASPNSAIASTSATMLQNMHDDNEASSPAFPIERILPPETMISTFDQLRAADPTGRSCDWLSHIETASRRGSLDRDAAANGRNTRKRSLRMAASTQFDLRGGWMDLASGGQRVLRNNMSLWELNPDRNNWVNRHVMGKEQDMERLEQRPATRRMSEDVSDCDTHRLRSLPAPPRAWKRRGGISTSTCSRSESSSNLDASALLQVAADVNKKPLAGALSDRTNKSMTHTRKSEGKELPDLERLVLNEVSSRTMKEIQKSSTTKTMTTTTTSATCARSPSRRLGATSTMRRLSTTRTRTIGVGRIASLA
ncbi:uncharacterized protein MEPE_02894 [Melanopsichium pennsylvanicum]|uniref:PH domain-containing protein n=2 Tax=Melanopsichium pennsylvanicum TaxID=63383 RepID=A0AAJ4XLJ7_9BASI|nr:hypothetical protein BN887_02408 [Melanopsichium pennsylvanicum 4]SNX84186.1 uncharacterized protein MEPE_02894 [Melanopsichium pennsylvanicum]